MLIDTHCHLDAAEFGGQQDELLRSAQIKGVTAIVIPSVARRNFAAVRSICEQYPTCNPAYGIHPIYAREATPDDLVVLRDYLQKHQPVAIGEIGLDFFIANYDQSQQEYYFTQQLKLAREFDLPVLLHTRRAIDTALKHLRRIKVRGGIAHAFSGSRQQADEFIQLGFKLGFGGAITYPTATRLRKLATTLPLSSIVLETDAPDMAPEFIAQGEFNKPEYLPRIAQILAELRGISVEEIGRTTSENAFNAIKKCGVRSRNDV
jgi:TatD DNase family protein